MLHLKRVLCMLYLLTSLLMIAGCEQRLALMASSPDKSPDVFTETLHLRTTPAMIESHVDMAPWIRAYGFHYPGLINTDEGLVDEIQGDFEQAYTVRQVAGVSVVVEHTSGLMWQQALSDLMDYEAANAYIRQLNTERYAGFEDWRLPTVEELASLLEAVPQNGDFTIDPVFEMGQTAYCFWSADQKPSGSAWVVSYNATFIYNGYSDWYDGYVRAVRTIETPG